MLRSDESDVLVPGERGAIDVTEARARAVDCGGGMSTESFESFDLSDATRCAVDEDKADICIGGRATGLGGLDSVEDSV
jgi:hypothetical protein